jgi:ParB-like chromosome segregation protein Spo0J
VTGYTCQLVEIARLRPTEMVDAAHVRALAGEMRRDGIQRRPVLVERGSLAILDGHHRFRAAQMLGLSRVSAVLIGYDDPRLTLSSWTDRAFTREDVHAAAESGVLLPAKSTRHLLDPPLPEMPVSVKELEGRGGERAGA